MFAPNNDDPNFFKSVFNNLSTFKCADLLLRGDFKLVQNIQKDKKGRNHTTHILNL